MVFITIPKSELDDLGRLCQEQDRILKEQTKLIEEQGHQLRVARGRTLYNAMLFFRLGREHNKGIRQRLLTINIPSDGPSELTAAYAKEMRNNEHMAATIERNYQGAVADWSVFAIEYPEIARCLEGQGIPAEV